MLSVIHGFSAKLSDAQVQALRGSARVDYVEPDRVVTTETTQKMDSSGQPWGLDRIDQVNLPLSRTYTYTNTGSGVTAYVIDTGIATADTDFQGRAAVAYDALGGNGQDCNGHGTHVAGTIGGATYGVAKSVQLRAVRCSTAAAPARRRGSSTRSTGWRPITRRGRWRTCRSAAGARRR